MVERGLATAIFGDPVLVDAGRGLVKATHPLDVMVAVLDGMARDRTRFEPMRVTAKDSSGRERTVRGFRLIGP
jgi:hypothetical protein